ncbi:GGDEF domain-containing protein [Paracoccus saliphilus]|uniref:diguanylate cyclase n=1 Tax=Paracoccus saliphilus TaxID=405559 RepID=A0AA45W373_9RHOB|nr:GGDEF domain-containing protein [Paracoccus saliphilus]WCR04911.1 GGDEF domain-containing protein [Paracoccus saliphilus]SIS72713.1 diguanylate cyclase (GGDEF) domain-containing protein [Paracoccus saliphilus]
MNDNERNVVVPKPVLLSAEDLAALLPQHLLVDAKGRLFGAGPTARKILSENARFLHDAFVITRPAKPVPLEELLTDSALHNERIELRMTGNEEVKLRGHVVRLADGTFLLNMGFGMTLPEAVRKLQLTDGDFAASSHAMELLFLHEANREFMRELSLFNVRLNDARREAESRSYTDPLTGLQNRRGLEQALELAIDATRGKEEARSGGGFAVAQVDLDHFKEVNDLYGHAAGDEVLRHVARVLENATRDGDVAARIGGDEFVMVLRGATNHKSLRKLGQRIISEIKLPVECGHNRCQVSASIGIAISTSYDHPTAEQLLADSDSALYSSKRDGRGRVSILTAPQNQLTSSLPASL